MISDFFKIAFFATCVISTPLLAKEKQTSSNPIFDGWYADPEVAVFGDTYWIFPTYSATFEDQTFIDAFSSKDLVNWKKHEKVISKDAIPYLDRALWAPSIIEKDGKYYLFYSCNNPTTPKYRFWKDEYKKMNQMGGIGVAVADKPEGPYQDILGSPIISMIFNSAQPIDQFVFKYKNDYYMIYGGWRKCNMVKLSKDFTSLEPFEDGAYFKDITPKNTGKGDGYVEGPVMFERNGKWYFMWSEGSWVNSTYCVAYAIGDSPFSDWKRLNTVLSQDPKIATGAGHHSVLNVPNTDDWYIVYHRRPLDNKGRDHRVTCIDRMYFNEDGTIKPIKMTFEGVKKQTINKAKF